MNNEKLTELLDYHNSIVKERYQVLELKTFKHWILSGYQNEDGLKYIELSSHTTISGNPIILELDEVI